MTLGPLGVPCLSLLARAYMFRAFQLLRYPQRHFLTLSVADVCVTTERRPPTETPYLRPRHKGSKEKETLIANATELRQNKYQPNKAIKNNRLLTPRAC